jgi:hypothetical protein
VSNGINLQLHAGQLQPLEKHHHHLDDFRINPWRVAPAQNFRVDLVKLAISSLLWTLAAEHRPDAVQLHRRWQLLHVVLDVRPASARRRLRPQRQQISLEELGLPYILTHYFPEVSEPGCWCLAPTKFSSLCCVHLLDKLSEFSQCLSVRF